LAATSAWQRELRSAMAARAGQIRENPFGAPLWTFLALAFGYGVIHAFGPGHGKCFAAAYFASRPARLRHALIMGGLMPAIHVASAVILVLGMLLAFDAATLGGVQERSILLQRLSYLLLTLIGCALFGKALLDLVRGEDHREERECADTRSMFGLALAVGVVPCPATAIVLIFCISQGLLAVGLAASVAIGLGMALTTSAVSMGTIFSRSGLARSLSGWRRTAGVIQRLLALSGSLLIAAFGLTLYLSMQ
jgi:nickel/cobalt transporter (NicO) family protein